MKLNALWNNQEFEKTLGYDAEKLMKLFDKYSEARLPYERMWKVLDAYDSGEFWKYVSKTLPGYTIKPDTNWVNWIKESYINSLYVGSYRGDVFCRNLKDDQMTLAINEFLEYTFNKLKIRSLQHLAGERAALLNFGAIELGWNADIIAGTKDHLFTGDTEAKFIDNLSLFLDPATKDYKKGTALFIAEEVPLVEILNEPRFKTRMKYFMENIKDTEEYKSSLSQREYGRGYYGERSHSANDNTVRLLTCYYKNYNQDKTGYNLDKIWILEDGFILGCQKNIKPKQFPVMVLYSNIPTKDPYGTPKAKLILNNAITINILDAIESTLIYKSLQRPKVMSRRAGINEKLFAEHGDDPNTLWVVDGNPNEVLRYIDLPNISQEKIVLLKQRLENSIMRVANVDDVYNGTDTNSVQTTGGMDILNQRLTVRDNGRINLLQNFIIDITEYILLLYLENAKERTFPNYNHYNEVSEIKEIKFENLRKEKVAFDFTCDVTPNLPNNAQRRAEVANIMMEKQMQYNFQPQLISPEEWLQYQDFPQKYKILQRIRAERMRNDIEDIESDLINYTGLIQKGVRPEAAIQMLASERQAKRDNPALGNTGNSGSFQNAQQG